MKTITATLEVVTPMFLGAADSQPHGIRSASIKGALRFWWRAWAWSAIRTAHSDDLAALAQLHAEEARLFGLAATDEGGGQGAFLLHVRDRTAKSTDQPFGPKFDNGILYLLGLGLGKSLKGSNHCTRSAIPARQGQTVSTFDIKLILRPGTPQNDQDGIVCALKLFGFLGALGSRARHGLGSVALKTIHILGQPDWQAPTTRSDYEQQLQALLPPDLTAHTPPLSAWSTQSRIDISAVGHDASKLLADLGREQQAYRSYGNQGMVNGRKSEYNFVPDHDLMRAVNQGGDIKKVPQRIVFGLPHNYFFSSNKDKPNKGMTDVNYRPEQGEGRRASPLLLHIHKVGEEYLAVHCLLRAQFLPPHKGEPARIEMKSGNRKNSVTLKEGDIQWSVLEEYLNRYNERKTLYGH